MKLFITILLCCAAEAQTISTIAGGGPRNLPALQIGFPYPSGLAIDRSGNVYVSLSVGFSVWKVDIMGNVTRFAGISFGYGGDGGPAFNASLTSPNGLAFDTSGNLFVADSYNSRIRKITPAGVITTVAGNGIFGFSGDGGPAVNAQLNIPIGIAIDSSNNLIIADANNHRIRSVSPSGIITTIAGNGVANYSGDGGLGTSASFDYPTSVAADSSGAVYIADPQTNRIRKLAGGIISTIAGTGDPGDSGDNGPAIAATLNSPGGVALDAFQNLILWNRFVSGESRRVRLRSSPSRAMEFTGTPEMAAARRRQCSHDYRTLSSTNPVQWLMLPTASRTRFGESPPALSLPSPGTAHSA